MLFVARDSQGAISEIHPAATAGAQEALPADNPEVLQFIQARCRQNELSEMDRNFVRVIEDIVELLIAKELILFTDLPVMVQDKFLKRRQVRQTLQFTSNYKEGESDIIQL
jgi:hypothetical protein